MARKDVVGEDKKRFPQDEEAEAWDEEDLGLDWDEAEFRRIAGQLRDERGVRPL